VSKFMLRILKTLFRGLGLCVSNAVVICVDKPTVAWHPLPEEPPRISAYTSYF